ncbi:MAG: Aliphatic amidase expression-regulating protein [Chlamydiales bacterium]|nr:Aliphatic amidase expression-regulating protein [Chlamydiales bacterium]MCH9619862.1 Aliphatic amidase expression-regulating protein [Chlamydiales bacterium]MCH9622711.1 Aliphatic amidase expression-regulating protein [Chlamydiales bacterium]
MKKILTILLLFGTLHGKPPIKVGILHSLTGTMKESETPVVDATLFAIEQLNSVGGVLGRKIEPVVVDGASSEAEFAKGAKKLILDEKVSVVFGCWTSASRKAVKPIFEKHQHLLFYPIQYEGLENSSSIIYTGAAPNQQIIPGTKWCLDHLGKNFFLIGSDYIFPKTANKIAKQILFATGGKVVGEEYLSLGTENVEDVIQKIRKANPDVILNTINGDTNRAFFKELYKQGVTSPVLSSSLTTNEIATYDITKECAGSYMCWNYFQSIDSEVNRTFIEEFHKEFGKDQGLDDPMEAAYIGVHIWQQAVERAETDEIALIKKTIKGTSFLAPEGMVFVDLFNNHLWKYVRIGKINSEGEADLLFTSDSPVRPRPFPLLPEPVQ